MLRYLGLTLFVSIAASGCSDYSKPDFERIQGKWNTVSVWNDGIDLPVRGSGFEFAAGRLTHLKDGEPVGARGTYRLDEHKRPKWLDVHNDELNTDFVGIYELDGDSLKICINETTNPSRPTEFKSDKGQTSQKLMVLTRIK